MSVDSCVQSENEVENCQFVSTLLREKGDLRKNFISTAQRFWNFETKISRKSLADARTGHRKQWQ